MSTQRLMRHLRPLCLHPTDGNPKEAQMEFRRRAANSRAAPPLTPCCVFRHEERTWSLERSDSILSDSPGMMSSSVGTSKCSSPACMEARARRAAHCGYSDSHRPGLQYGDSFDSLGDSPHSDRCGAARWWLVAVVLRLQ